MTLRGLHIAVLGSALAVVHPALGQDLPPRLPSQHQSHSTNGDRGSAESRNQLSTAPEPVPTAQTTATTLESLEAIAWQRNPTLAQARAKIVQAEGRSIQARLYPNPRIGYEAEEMGAEGTAAQQGIFFEQTIVTGGKLALSGAKFSQETNQARWQAEAQQYRVLNAVRIRFYEVLALQRLIELQRELLEIAEEAVRIIDQLANVGQANKADLLQARIEARQLEIALRQTQIRYEAAWRELTALIGEPCLPLTSVSGDLEAAAEIPELERLYCILVETSPEAQVARTRISRNRFALLREQVEPLPNIDIHAGTAYDFASGDQLTDVTVGLVVPLWDKNQGNIRVARGQLSNAQAELRRVELSIRQRLAEAYKQHGTALVTVEEYSKNILPQSREVYELYLESFRNRRAAWPQVLVAQRGYFEAATEYLEALVDARRAEVALNGFLLVDGLDEPAGPESEGDAREGEQNRLRESLENPIMGREGRGPNERIGGRR